MEKSLPMMEGCLSARLRLQRAGCKIEKGPPTQVWIEETMCLAVPGRIQEIYQKDGMKMARVDFGGVLRETCLDYVPEARVGDYCIIHVGFAISLLSEKEARETLAMFDDIARLEQEPGTE